MIYDLHDVSELDACLEEYVRATIMQGLEMQRDPRKANYYFDVGVRCLCRIRELEHGLERLAALMEHENEHVQVETAAFLLSVYPMIAEQTLKRNRRRHGDDSFDADMILIEWKRGNLKFPYLVDDKIVYRSAYADKETAQETMRAETLLAETAQAETVQVDVRQEVLAMLMEEEEM